MFEQFDPRSAVPLYGQIASTGRSRAARLHVNPATVVQAYRELEAYGFVEMQRIAPLPFARQNRIDHRRPFH